MGEIIDIKENTPHVSGEAHCMLCKYAWVAVAPVGTVWLECTNCGSMKGLYKFHCERNEPVWECKCGNGLFQVNPDGVFCPNCGLEQNGF